MRKYFEHAYQAVCNIGDSFLEFAGVMTTIATVTFIYLTVPFWIIPYAICKKLKERGADNA